MNFKYKKLTAAVALLIPCFIIFLNWNKDFLLLWNVNHMHVTVDTPLSADSVKIEFGMSANTINTDTDKDLFVDRERYTVLYDGKIVNELINDYGENDFLITYGNRYYLSFRQFKMNRRHQHDYYYHFYQEGNTLFIQVKIKGKDGMNFKHQMIEIGQAGKYKYNSLPDSTKVLYDGVELYPLKK